MISKGDTVRPESVQLYTYTYDQDKELDGKPLKCKKRKVLRIGKFIYFK